MIWVNGVVTDTLPVTDRGLLYGDGVWETISIRDGVPQLLDWHMERLLQGLQALAITPPDMQQLMQEIHATSSLKQQGVMKLVVTRGSGQRGYNPHGLTDSTRIIQSSECPVYPVDYARQGIRLALCETALAHQPRLAGFKHLNRLEQVLARAEFGADFQEGLVRDYHGHVIEGTMSNLFVLMQDGSVHTPDLHACGIAGVMRRLILKVLGEWGIPCHIRDIGLEDIKAADSLFMTNSLIGVWPVREFAGQYFNTSLPLLQSLQTKVNPLI
jgi:4-amino-4-deoxychorismate lyase